MVRISAWFIGAAPQASSSTRTATPARARSTSASAKRTAMSPFQ